jgi:SAM-dependent methyltransferase
MVPWSGANSSYKFGPFGPSLADVCPGVTLRRVLDLGCGDGTNTRLLSSVATEVWGVDCNSQLIKRARATHPTGHYRVDTAEGYLNTTSLMFDGVVCSRLLGFVPDLHVLFSALRTRTKSYFLLSDWHPMACWVMPNGIIGMDYSAEGSFAPGQYHHTIATIMNALIDCDFAIRKVVEGPIRQCDPSYAAAPLAVRGLPLCLTWVCTSGARTISSGREIG